MALRWPGLRGHRACLPEAERERGKGIPGSRHGLARMGKKVQVRESRPRCVQAHTPAPVTRRAPGSEGAALRSRLSGGRRVCHKSRLGPGPTFSEEPGARKARALKGHFPPRWAHPAREPSGSRPRAAGGRAGSPPRCDPSAPGKLAAARPWETVRVRGSQKQSAEPPARPRARPPAAPVPVVHVGPVLPLLHDPARVPLAPLGHGCAASAENRDGPLRLRTHVSSLRAPEPRARSAQKVPEIPAPGASPPPAPPRLAVRSAPES
jgi:hypothetical protein